MSRTNRTRPHALRIVPAVLLLGFAGCAMNDGQPIGAHEPAPGEELPILWQKSGTYSRISRMIRLVARDRQTLAQVPLSEIPVNFETQMVLVVGLGPTPTNELGVRITRVWRDGSVIRVQERRIHPGTGGSPGLEPASPWTVAVVPKSDLNVEGFATRVPRGALTEHPGAR